MLNSSAVSHLKAFSPFIHHHANHSFSQAKASSAYPHYLKHRLQAKQSKTLLEVFESLLEKQEQKQTGSYIKLENVSYQPPGATTPLLDNVNLEMEANKMGLIFGKSGSGKTTLLQVIAGLNKQDCGKVCLSKTYPLSKSCLAFNEQGVMFVAYESSQKFRLQSVGMVFQFPERHFLGHTIRTELTFGWPRTQAAVNYEIQKIRKALSTVGLTSFDLDMPTETLSGGFKRRLALAVQLVRQPTLLLLDEPLAGLDWKAREDMLYTLRRLKLECTILVVSHDLKEIKQLVDQAWKMTPGGHLSSVHWPVT